MAVRRFTGDASAWQRREAHALTPENWEVTHEGLVVALTEHNWYDDSDFIAIVWNEEEGKPERVIYATTRGWTYANGAEIDAPPEIQEKYREYVARGERERVERVERERAEREARTPSKGKRVRVARGRKVPIGTEGVVIWRGEGKWGWRVGIKDADGEVHWTAESNVEILEGVTA